MNKVKLNLGCGSNIKKGYENYDCYMKHPKIKWIDLEILPLGFKENSVDEILLYSVLEHLWINPYKFMLEMHRILKKGGVIKIKLPFYHPVLGHVRCHHTKYYFNTIVDFKHTDKYKKTKSGQPKKLYKMNKSKYQISRIHFRYPFIFLNIYYEMEKI